MPKKKDALATSHLVIYSRPAEKFLQEKGYTLIEQICEMRSGGKYVPCACEFSRQADVYKKDFPDGAVFGWLAKVGAADDGVIVYFGPAKAVRAAQKEGLELLLKLNRG